MLISSLLPNRSYPQGRLLYKGINGGSVAYENRRNTEVPSQRKRLEVNPTKVILSLIRSLKEFFIDK